MMTNYTIEELCDKHDIPLIYCGYKDLLTQVPKRHGGHVLNLRDSTDNKPGTHWVSFWIEPKKQFYMDSFGFPPPEVVEHYLNKGFHWNGHQIQNIRGGHCGHYCVGFLLAMSRKRRRGETGVEVFTRYLSMFSDDVTKNDDIIDEYLTTRGHT